MLFVVESDQIITVTTGNLQKMPYRPKSRLLFSFTKDGLMIYKHDSLVGIMMSSSL